MSDFVSVSLSTADWWQVYEALDDTGRERLAALVARLLAAQEREAAA